MQRSHILVLGLLVTLAAAAPGAAVVAAGNSAHAGVTVVPGTPLTLSCGASTLQFGNKLSGSPGTVVIAVDATGALQRTLTGSVQSGQGGNSGATQTCTITGQANSTYSISLGAPGTAGGYPVTNLTIWSQSSSPHLITSVGKLSAAGSDTIQIGGTLNITGALPNGNIQANQIAVNVGYQ